VNLTLLGAIVLLVAWIVLGFVVAVPAGWVHLCYAGAAVLFVRRVLIGAPRFRS
jgi:hypothetical protein